MEGFNTKERQEGFARRIPKTSLQKSVLEIKRVSRTTKKKREFSFGALTLVKDETKRAVNFAYAKGQEASGAIRKSSKKAAKKLTTYFVDPPRTISRDIMVKYKSTKILLKPAPAGTGISAGSVLGKLFKFLGIKDVSAKIIGSRNKLNVIKGAFKILEIIRKKQCNI